MLVKTSFLFCTFLFLILGCNHQTTSPYPKITTIRVSSNLHATGPKILCVVAHPDDEVAFAGTLYKTTTFLKGACDIVLITNGEGGFKYSTLAEPIYGKELTEEKIGRAALPKIRQKEFIEGCKIMGIRQIFLFKQKDHRYTRDPNEVIGKQAKVWDLNLIQDSLHNILKTGNYDYLLTHLPVPETHGHHKAATILALRAVKSLPSEKRPVLLGAGTYSKEEGKEFSFTQLPDFPLTKINKDVIFSFDRTQKFGYKQNLNYQIIVNWVIAEHKSQGTMQLGMNRGKIESYFFYELNSPKTLPQIKTFFQQLEKPQFKSKTYGPSAGISK